VSNTKSADQSQHMTATKNIANKSFTFTLMQFTKAISHHAGSILTSML
jgi:hypothetical protein